MGLMRSLEPCEASTSSRAQTTPLRKPRDMKDPGRPTARGQCGRGGRTVAGGGGGRGHRGGSRPCSPTGRLRVGGVVILHVHLALVRCKHRTEAGEHAARAP